MPINRCTIKNEYKLGFPDLYNNNNSKDDPQGLLEGVSMSALVGLLRQLGDLAQFAAEIFHDLHEEVMTTAARGHSLTVRVQQLESEFPLIERKLLLQTSHTSLLYNSGIDWHPNPRMNQNPVASGDLPRFVMESYEECRGPPRLFLLDKFDIAGAGACLKRFTDPSFFKAESTPSTDRNSGQREKKTRKVKKRGPRWRNGDTPESFPSSHVKLHQLFLEESIETGVCDPQRRVKLKKKQFSRSRFDQDKGESYMEKILDSYSPTQNTVHDICIDALALTWRSEDECESGLEMVKIGTVSPLKESIETDKMLLDSCNIDGLNSNEGTNEIDNYMDALATIESETDSECNRSTCYSSNLRPIVVDSEPSEGKRELQSYDSHSVGNSITSEESSSFFRARESATCSASVDSLTETTPDVDHRGSNIHIEKMSVIHRSMSEVIPDNGISIKSYSPKGDLGHDEHVNPTSTWSFDETDAPASLNTEETGPSEIQDQCHTPPKQVDADPLEHELVVEEPGQLNPCSEITIEELPVDSSWDALNVDAGANNAVIPHSNEPKPVDTFQHSDISQNNAIHVHENMLAEHIGSNADGLNQVDHSSSSFFTDRNAPEKIYRRTEIDENLLLAENIPEIGNSDVAETNPDYATHIQTPKSNDRDESVNFGQPMVNPNTIVLGNDDSISSNEAKQEVEDYAPPLPPLPPLQWRLSRFHNSFEASQWATEQRNVGLVEPVPATITEVASLNSVDKLRTDIDRSFTTSTSAISHFGELDVCVTKEGVTSLDSMDAIRRDDDLVLSTRETTESRIGQSMERPYQPSEDHRERIPEPSDVKVDVDTDGQDERHEHIDRMPQGFVAPMPGMVWSGAYDGGMNDGDGNGNGTFQKKLPRPRNPLIYEVVAIDKSKLRKVERVKPTLEPNIETRESILEQTQLRKVERVKPTTETKPDEVISLLENLQLRKVGERVKTPIEQKTQERDPLLQQVQLRKVGESAKPESEDQSYGTNPLSVSLRKVKERISLEGEDNKGEEMKSPRVQLRKVGDRVKLEGSLKDEERELPKVRLRKVGERAHSLAMSKTEDRDSILEQIRKKSFNLKPADVGRPKIQAPNIQGPRKNLKVVAIIEKASNIRQAMVGSDEEDDTDTWE